jgi:hypothetical protein
MGLVIKKQKNKPKNTQVRIENLNTFGLLLLVFIEDSLIVTLIG